MSTLSHIQSRAKIFSFNHPSGWNTLAQIQNRPMIVINVSMIGTLINVTTESNNLIDFSRRKKIAKHHLLKLSYLYTL